MFIEVKNGLDGLLGQRWKLIDNRIVLAPNYMSMIPKDGLFLKKRTFSNDTEKIIYLETIEGISEVINFGQFYFSVIISEGLPYSLNTFKSELDKLNCVRDYIIKLRNFDKNNDKYYLSNFEFNIDDDANIIASEIVNQLFAGELIIDNNKYDLIDIFKKLKKCGIIKKIEELSLIKCDEFASNQELTNYSVTCVKDSSNGNIKPGNYFYSFEKSGDLNLLRIPLVDLKLYDLESGYLTYNIVNIVDNFVTTAKKIIIPSEEICDFEITGTQLSLTNSKNHYSTPNALTTMFTEFLFGSSYAILKGMSNQMVRIESKVEDLRLIQVILKDKSDIRFNGVVIYYDFKRYLGEVKNRKKLNSTVEKEPYKLLDINNSSKSVLEQMKEFKEMLDLGIISSEEFDKKKKELLNL